MRRPVQGNAGMETAGRLLDVANYIHVTSRSPVRLSVATHYVGDVRLLKQTGAVIEGYQLKSQNGFYDTNWAALMDKVEFQKSEEDGRIRIVPIEGGLANKSAVRKYVYPLNRAYDSVLVCTGWKFDNAIFSDECKPQMLKMQPRRDLTGTRSSDLQFKERSKKYPSLNGGYESVNVPGMYFAGTITHGKDWRKAAGGFIHGFRYTAQALHRVLEQRVRPCFVRHCSYLHDSGRSLSGCDALSLRFVFAQIEGQPWPSTRISLRTPAGMRPSLLSPVLALMQIIRARVNEASSYYQMFGFLWDVASFDPNDMSSVTFYYDVPKDYVHTELVPDSHFTLEISFDYGATHPDCPGMGGSSGHAPDGAMCAASPARDIFKAARTPFANPGWMGVSEFLHPVFKLHYPKDAMPDSLPPGSPYTAKKVRSPLPLSHPGQAREAPRILAGPELRLTDHCTGVVGREPLHGPPLLHVAGRRLQGVLRLLPRLLRRGCPPARRAGVSHA